MSVRSSGGFGEWVLRVEKATDEPTQAGKTISWSKQIQEAYLANRKVYGSLRLHVELREQGISCSRRRAARLMREMGLSPHRPRHRRLTTHSDPSARVAANLLDHNFPRVAQRDSIVEQEEKKLTKQVEKRKLRLVSDATGEYA